MSIKDGKEQMHEAIADMFERNKLPIDLFGEKLSIAKSYLESKGIELLGFSYDANLNVLSVEFDAGIGRALINTVGDSKNDIEEIIAACIKDVKPFDISGYEFSDSIAEIKAKANAGSTTTLDVFEKWLMLNKPDAIAIAKALGVTGEDLL